MKRSLFGVSLLLFALMTSGAICKRRDTVPDTITLQYWTVFQEEEDILAGITAFRASYPYVEVEVRQLKQEGYEDELISAWARGEGPDLFSIPNSHVGKFKELIEPLPSTINLTSVVEKKNLGSTEQIVTPQTLRTVSVQQLSSIFPEVVSDDVVMVHKAGVDDKASEKIFGLPYSMDTMVLYYNKDMLNQANIAVPPSTWDQFVTQVPKMTLVDIDNNIIQSGASIGTSNNVPRSFDIVSLLMLQNGAVMTSGDNVTFASDSKNREDFNPGQHATEFYTSFANEDVEWYSWNPDQADALESFIDGNVAYFFGYHYHLEELQRRAPNLNFDIAKIPQVDPNNKVNYANYWLETVSVSSSYPDEAWGLIESMTTEQDNAQLYATATERPAALKSLLDDQSEDYVLSIFADQSLTAQSWYSGLQPIEAEEQFAEMITLINEDRLDVATAVNNTAERVQLTYEK